MESYFGQGASEEPGEEVCLVGLWLGGNCLWCLVIFMGLGGAKR